jgi:hypothetical protein
LDVIGGKGIVPQDLLVAVQERLDRTGLNVLDGIDVLGLGSLGVCAPISGILILPGGGTFLLGGGFLSLGSGFVSLVGVILVGAILLLRPTDGLLVGGPRPLPFGQASIASQCQSAHRAHARGQREGQDSESGVHQHP